MLLPQYGKPKMLATLTAMQLPQSTNIANRASCSYCILQATDLTQHPSGVQGVALLRRVREAPCLRPQVLLAELQSVQPRHLHPNS